MKQLALGELLSQIYGTPRFGGRFDVGRWEEVPDAAIAERVDRLLAEFRQVASIDGDWPGVWLSIALESLAEFQECFPDDDEDELEAYREEEFPEILWMRVDAREDEREQALFLYPMGIPIIFRTSENLAVVPGPWSDDRRDRLLELLDWLARHVSQEVSDALADPAAYAEHLEAALPRSERLGWFRRRDLWDAAPHANHVIKSELTDRQRRTFVESVAFDDAAPLQNLTANDYFRFVEICYCGAGYDGLEGLTPHEKYKRLADGRHDGLLDIDPDSPDALAEWTERGSHGGHPWEIARGGNRTHISLYLHKDAEGYHLGLAGTAATRAAETIRMALSLVAAGVPVTVRDIALHKKRVLGEDLIAIVPDPYVGAYPYVIRGLFPDDTEVLDHVSHNILEEHPELAGVVRWLPLPGYLPAMATTSEEPLHGDQ